MLWIWRGVRIRLPDDWEMLEFSRNQQNGSCAFADRYQFRLQLSWRVLSGEPDLQRMVSDTCSKLQAEGAERVRTLSARPWQGLGSVEDGIKTTRYIQFFPDPRLLLEVVFCWPERIDKKREHRILRSVDLGAIPEAGAPTRWRAFGMDLVASPRTTLNHCRAEPAHVEMQFTNDGGDIDERFARRGMKEFWLNQPLDVWLRSWIPKGVSITSQDKVHRSQHQVERLAGEMLRPGILGRFRERLRCDAVAWVCPDDGRVYSSSRLGPGDTTVPAGSIVGSRFSCCERLGCPDE